ncbi:MAG TPA: hypothetical protein VL098_03595, partial [Flavipsychrobacter sp.]|nr:hypothetical protein [Flavipsychrobacter sp.]
MILSLQTQAATYYYEGSGSISAASNWNLQPNGSGTSPSNFNGTNTWIIQTGQTVSTTGNWNISVLSSGTELVVDSGAQLTLGNGHAITVANFIVRGTYVHNSGSNNIPGIIPFIGGSKKFHSGNNGSSNHGTVIIQNLGTTFGIGNTPDGAIEWGNLTFNVSSTNTVNAPGREIRDVKGDLTVNSGVVILNNSTTNTSTTIGGNVDIKSGATLYLSAALSAPVTTVNIGKDLKIAGTLDRTALGGNATVVFKGSNNSMDITGTLNNGTINWTIDNGANITLNGNLTNENNRSFTMNSTSSFTIAPTSVFGNDGTADFAGQKVTIRSDASGSGTIRNNINDILNASHVTIERYIPNRRAWRLLAAPLAATGAPSILEAWQENGSGTNPNPGYGTWVSAPTGTPANGFDAVSPSTSIQHWTAAGAWATPSNTNTIKVTDSGAAWFLFVRGDKSLTTGTVSGTTTLRMTGTLRQGNQTTGVASSTLSLIANPYASTIDYEALYQANSPSAAKRTLYLWDANQGTTGAYRTVTRAAGSATYTSVPAAPGGTNPRYILSGQAFFVGANTTMNFTEAMKSTSTPMPVFKTTDDATTGGEALNVNLNLLDNGVAIVADGLRIEFDAAYTNTPSAEEDIVKLSNPRENLSISNNNADYVIER